MSAMVLLLGMLVVAYLGSLLLSGRVVRGYGLPSGSEWLMLGFVLGPALLGVASESALRSFEPLAGISMGWIALVLGAEYGYAGERRVTLRGFWLGVSFALASAGLTGAAVYAVARYLAHFSAFDAALIAAGMGLSSCETARYAVRWASARSTAQGPIHALLEDMADSDEVVPLVGVGVSFAFAPSSAAIVPLTAAAWIGIAAGLGVALGLTCAMLLRGMHRARDAWPVLVGAALLGTGVAWRLGLAPLTVMFVMGVVLSLGSRHGPELRRMLARTEPAVLLPTLLLAGGLVRFETHTPFLLVLGAGVLARCLVRGLLGSALAGASETPSRMRVPLALGFLSTGALTTLIGLGFAFRFRGPIGDLVLACAFTISVVGELVGPLSLSRALSQGDQPLEDNEPAAPAEESAA